MPDDFGNVNVTPPAAPVRNARRLRRFVVTMDEETGKQIKQIDVEFLEFNSTDEQTLANPNGVVSIGGANSYRGANASALKGRVFQAGAKAEIETRLAEDNIDEGDPATPTI